VVVVPPLPIFLLVILRQFSKVPVRIPMSLGGPLVIKPDLAVIPPVIVGVSRIVYPIADACMHSTTG
jgi:hypothetical protein